jgi:hypothetical protein
MGRYPSAPVISIQIWEISARKLWLGPPQSEYGAAMRQILAPFTRHPHAVGETYLEHLAMAFSFGGRLLGAGCACLIHGLLPFLFVKTGSRMIRDIHADLHAPRGHTRKGFTDTGAWI